MLYCVEQGGRLKNRGSPLPREREFVNEKRDIRWVSRSEQSQLEGNQFDITYCESIFRKSLIENVEVFLARAFPQPSIR